MKVFFFTHDQLAQECDIDFAERFRNEGDWEIDGTISATSTCPAEVVAAILDALFGAKRSREWSGGKEPLDALRSYREQADLRGLRAWWGLAERHLPVVARLARRDGRLAAELATVLRSMPSVLGASRKPLPRPFIESAARVLEAVRASGDRRARRDACRALSALAHVQGKSASDALRFLGGVGPARHPRAHGARIIARVTKE